MERIDVTSLVERTLAGSDVAAGFALSSAAGWNQTTADWAYLLRVGHGFGFVTPDAQLVATALTLPYPERIGWISMVLVAPAYRGRGLASRLVERCIASLQAAARTPILDATPAGFDVYRRIGFVGVGTFRRLRRPGAGGALDARVPAGVALRPLAEADLPRVVRFDRAAFGSPRPALLRALLARRPAAAWIAIRNGRVTGFSVGRDGRDAVQVGPLIATDAAVALALAERALSLVRGPVLVDVPDVHAELQSRLRAAGFEEERALTRMVYGSASTVGRPGRTFAVAGPELG